MMTKVNMSFHETIIIILSVRLGSDESMSSNCLGKCIIFVSAELEVGVIREVD